MTRTDELVPTLVADLDAEVADLRSLLVGRRDADWDRPTPAAGWTVRDQVSHLAHFDWATRLAVTEPEAFVALRDGLPDLQAYVDSIGPANASRDGADMLEWWDEQHRLLHDAFLRVPAGLRVPWFGPPMGVASKVTARVMETWAHGQDVADALALRRTPTDRLAHVARIGVRTFGHSFAVRGLDVPDPGVRVELLAPDGGTPWAWGEPEATDRVSGPAEDFCLVVTQRRHFGDTGLQVTGSVAAAWMTFAQAFAGPPGPGRRRGQFAEVPA